MHIDESVEIPDGHDEIAMAMMFGSTAKEKELEKFPMRPKLIQHEQKRDKYCQQLVENNKASTVTLEGIELLAIEKRIIVPKVLRERILAWYHLYLAHPGRTRMEETIKQIFTWKNMSQDIYNLVKTCKMCQLNKTARKKYGHLPAKTAEKSEPWNRVNVDMIGPYQVTAQGKTYELRALTMIDPATGWFEIKELKKPSAEACMEAFDDAWLARYPRPQYIGFDQGNEYKSVFAEMCDNYGITKKISTTYNPQSNGIIERVHQVVNNGLRTLELENSEFDVDDPWSALLSSVAYAIRTTYHTTLQASPAQLVFGRDMLFPIKFNADWTSIRARRQAEIERNNSRENSKRISHDYKIGDKVLIEKPGINRKLSTPRSGPHVVKKVYTNGTVLIQRGAVTERVNIRRLTPYFE
jgi:transposase InsO family protein